MKILPRTQFGNPILRQKAKKVSSAFLKTAGFKKLVPQMFYTMKRANGVGLAAPQIGLSLQLAVIQVQPTRLRPNLEDLGKIVIINPRIVGRAKEQVDDWEGCLSFPGVRGKTPRHKSITVEYLDEKGKKVVRKLAGFLARVFQHEIDHLNGTVYVDRMKDMKTLMILPEFKERILKQ
jgi:peptide deformylase